MTLKEYFIKGLCTVSLAERHGGPEFIWKQLNQALEEKFLGSIRIHPESKVILEKLFEDITGDKL